MRYLLLLLAALLPPPALATEADAPAAAVHAADAAPLPPDAAPAGDAVAPVAPPPSWVYLVTRVKLKDTDITQAAFLRHPQVTTLEACEAERAAGLTSGWRHFNRYYFRTLRGISYQIDFRCVEGGQYLAPWRGGEPLTRHYLVTTTDDKLQVEAQASFFACRRALRQVTREETIDTFCATASQAILPPPLPEADEAEAAPADAPPLTPAPGPAPATVPATPAP